MNHLIKSMLIIVLSLTFKLGAQATVFEQGDLAIVAVNANNGTCSGSGGEDLISFVCFKDLTTGTTLDFTDNGWERLNAGFWGTTEGVMRLTRTGATIPAGTVITIQFNNTIASGISPDANWSFTNLNGFSSFNMNTSGDQVYIMQGGLWINGGTHFGLYDGGTILFGFSTTGGWATFTGSNLGTQQSVIYPGTTCLSFAPTASTDYAKFQGPLIATTQRIWMERISDSSNWADYISCNFYNVVAPVYQAGYSIGIVPGGFREGYWLGDDALVDDDWSNCENWENLVVPDADTDVVIQPLNATVGPFTAPVVYNTGNECHSLAIWSGGQLTINAAGALDVYTDILNNGTLNATGNLTLTGNTNSTITGASGLPLRTLNLSKLSGAAIFTDTTITITANGALNFTSGVVFPLSGDPVIFQANAGANGASNASYVDGLVRKIGNDDFDFPVGDGFYQHISIENIGSFGSEFEAQFINGNGPGIYGYNWVPSINNVATCNYWILNRNSGTTARVRLSWGNDSDCGITNLADLVVSRFDGTIWQNHGQLSTTGNAASGTVLSFDLINDFSPFALASRSSDNPLPVAWLDFRAALSAPRAVTLDWSTASEINNDYFAVEHSIDGIVFNELVRVPGAGSTNIPKDYQWVHTSPRTGSNYYRLRQTDFDGTADYSPVRHVRIDAGWQVFVAHGKLELRTPTLSENTRIQVFDASGRLVSHQRLGSGTAFTVDLPHLSRGVYVVQLSSNGAEPFRERIAF